jgi:hypothetical protein
MRPGNQNGIIIMAQNTAQSTNPVDTKQRYAKKYTEVNL